MGHRAAARAAIWVPAVFSRDGGDPPPGCSTRCRPNRGRRRADRGSAGAVDRGDPTPDDTFVSRLIHRLGGRLGGAVVFLLCYLSENIELKVILGLLVTGWHVF